MGAALKVEAQRIAKPEASARANVMWSAEAARDLFCFFFMDGGVVADSTGSLVVLVLFWGVFRRV